ncbi:MAG: class I SAM-dependent methyltransferase [Proteobacteria bacterium]|nr:class I SAM-dependent methyltransferase [Pseudomonadota bacterium]
MNNYRHRVGPKDLFDTVGVQQFVVLLEAGLRETHSVLDVGCGCLRAGRFFIVYLDEGKYCGIEPNHILLDNGIDNELSRGLVEKKRARFKKNDDFNLAVFEQKFDFVLAQSIITHATKAQTETIFESAGKVLKDDGRFFFTYWEGSKINSHAEWYPGRASYPIDFLKKKAKQNGMELEELTNFKHPNRLKWARATKRQ